MQTLTRHLEYNSKYPWVNYLLNLFPLCYPEEYMHSFGVAWGFKEQGKWSWMPRIVPNDVQFYNSIFMFRVNWLPGIFVHIRWSEKQDTKSLLQFGIGWKLLGRIALIFRVQSDVSSEHGYNSPNLGQSKGFEYGPH